MSPGQFSLQVVYSLVGGANGSGTADLTEQIKIQNRPCALAFNFFQYANFQLGGPGQRQQPGGATRDQPQVAGDNEALVTTGNIALTENVDSAISPEQQRGSGLVAQ